MEATMCGRFTLTSNPEQLQESFPGILITHEVSPRYNIAPSQPIAVIPNSDQTRLDYYTWGLVPHWAKDPSIGSRLINARSETLDEKPAFRTAYRRRRCLILADGFFEWMSTPGTRSKTPMLIKLKSGNPFAFAGLWEVWNSPDGSTLKTCCIITTQPNSLMAPIHNRMPVILPSEAYTLWLDPLEISPSKVNPLLVPYNPDEMIAFPVSREVNNPQYDNPVCVQPL
jgi:putative SOS response-associated peptidase YedK